MMHISADVFGERKSLVKPVTRQQNLQLYQVVRFFRLRSSCTAHISAYVQRITLNASSCITISGGIGIWSVPRTRLSCRDRASALQRCFISYDAHHLCLIHHSSCDSLLQSALQRICNSDFSDSQWLQASLPVRDGGLGVRRVSSLALPAYLASAASTLSLQNEILSGCAGSFLPDLLVVMLGFLWRCA